MALDNPETHQDSTSALQEGNLLSQIIDKRESTPISWMVEELIAVEKIGVSDESLMAHGVMYLDFAKTLELSIPQLSTAFRQLGDVLLNGSPENIMAATATAMNTVRVCKHSDLSPADRELLQENVRKAGLLGAGSSRELPQPQRTLGQKLINWVSELSVETEAWISNMDDLSLERFHQILLSEIVSGGSLDRLENNPKKAPNPVLSLVLREMKERGINPTHAVTDLTTSSVDNTTA